jgi:hypothetical protein
MLAPAPRARLLVALVAVPLWMVNACAADQGDSAKPYPPPGGGGDDVGVDANPTPDSSGGADHTPPPVEAGGMDAPSQFEASGSSSGGRPEAGSEGGVDAPPPVDSGGCTNACMFTAEYMTSLTGGNVSDIGASFEIMNNTALSQDLSTVTLRYWFLANGAPMLQFSCDYAMIGCMNVSAKFVTMPKALPKADTYLEISFSATVGMLASGDTTGTIQTRFHDMGYQVMFTPSGDYSFNAMDTSFMPSTTITVYNKGQLVWGVEP